jgi:hypothetical protein
MKAWGIISAAGSFFGLMELSRFSILVKYSRTSLPA